MAAQLAPLTGLELQLLSNSRLQEAKVLLANQLYDGAVYLAGYALEMALKARICKLLDSDYPQGRDEFKSFMTHDIETLVRLAGLTNSLNLRKRDAAFATNWSQMVNKTENGKKGWSENWRYRSIESVSQVTAEELINALDDPTSGILPWIHSLW